MSSQMATKHNLPNLSTRLKHYLAQPIYKLAQL